MVIFKRDDGAQNVLGIRSLKRAASKCDTPMYEQMMYGQNVEGMQDRGTLNKQGRMERVYGSEKFSKENVVKVRECQELEQQNKLINQGMCVRREFCLI